MKTFALLPVVLALICNFVEHAKSEVKECPASGTIPYTETKGSIDVTNTNCTFVVSNNISAPNTLSFGQLALKSNDTLDIYDGNPNEKMIIVSFNATSKVETRLVVGTSPNLTIVYTASPSNYSGSSWSINYNTKECTVNIENFWATRIESPIFYIPKNSSATAYKTTAVSCTYNVNSTALPSDQKVVVSIGQFSLKGNSSLILNETGQAPIEYKENSAKDDFFLKSGKIFQAALKIQNTSLQQKFSLVIGAVVEACSGESTESWTLTQLPSQPVGFECRQLIRLPKKSSVFQVRLNSLTVVPGSDKLTVIQGGSTNAQALASITTNVTDYLLIAPGSSIIISYVSNNVVGNRSVNLTVAGSGYGGYLNGQGQLTFTNKADAEDVYYQLVADKLQVVKVTILSELEPNSTVSFYNGLQQTDTPILTLSSESQLLEEIIGGPAMLVKLSGFPKESNFSANFTSIQSGCASVATDSSGHISYSSDKAGQSCSFVIAPQKVTGTIIVVLDSLTLKNDATVKVYDGHGVNKKLVAEFVSPVENQLNAPQIYVPVANTVSIIVSGAASITVHYLTFPGVCGGALKNPSDTILTPNYPNQYPLNADCLWYTKDTSKQFLYLSFQDFLLAGNHTIDIVNVTNSSSPQVLESFRPGQSAGQLPGDVVVAWNNDTQIQFNSHHEETTQVARGANISSRVLECGGTYHSDGTFQSPDYPATKNTSCVWVINVPEELNKTSTSIVNFTLKTSDYASVDKFLKIHDGNSTRSPLLTLPKSEEHSILSRYDRIVLIFNSTTILAAVQVNFTTKICTELCHNGICLHDDWRCNGVDDCGDNTDEQNCNSTTPIPPPSTTPTASPKPTTTTITTTTKAPVQDFSGWVKSGWVPGCLFIGLLLGALLVFAVPKVIRRLRHSSSNYSRMGDNVANA